MSEDTLVYTCIGGIAILAVLIIVLANRMSARSNQKRADKMMKARHEGTYDPKKNYTSRQGGWEAGDGPYDHQDASRD